MKDLDVPAHIQQADMEQAALAQSAAELRNAMKRHMARMAQFNDWVKAENIKNRQERHKEEAAKALARAIEMIGEERKLLPVPDPLPPEMKGQSASTIQAMLRNGWRPE